jgi:hypothetical protein
MTPEEEAVINAAIDLVNSHLLDAASGTPDYYLSINLMEAIKSLEAARTPTSELRWYLTTWKNVRAGDRVRFPNAREFPATVSAIARSDWHVDPQSARTRNPIAREWSELVVRVAHNPDALLTIRPTDAIEIGLREQEHDVIMLLGGWDNRLE